MSGPRLGPTGAAGVPVNVADLFDAAVAARVDPAATEPALLPEHLAGAAAEVLSASAAGLSLFTADGVPVPIGASTEEAAVAERLQFTVGQGPCLTAHESMAAVRADGEVLAERWPMFARQLVERTPFRSVAAVPLPWPLLRVGTIDLLFDESDRASRLDLEDTETVAARIATTLLAAFGAVAPARSGGTAVDLPPWLDDSHSPRRAVFIATGMLNVASEISTGDALAVLRAHAFSTDSTVDDVARQIVTGDLPLRALRPGGDE